MTTTTQWLEPAPAPFDFVSTVTSNGWMELLPNSWDEERHILQRVQRLSDRTVVLLSMADATAGEQPQIGVTVSHAQELSPAGRTEVAAVVRRMFRLDEDFTEFYALCRERGEQWAGLTAGAGRMLRSPTVFEDVVKTICTTNTFWAATKSMVARLAANHGAPYPGDPSRHAFPTPEAIAAVPNETFVATAHMGYRAAYIHALAQQVTGGRLDLEALRSSDLATPALQKKLLAIKGVGPYAAAVLLTLLGRYDELPVDTAFRTFVTTKHFAGIRPSDTEAQAVYADWGKWKYLAYWYEVWLWAQEHRQNTAPKRSRRPATAAGEPQVERDVS